MSLQNQIPSPPQIPKIRVVVRKRPLSVKEFSKGQEDIIQISEKRNVTVKETKTKINLEKYIEEHNFTFDIAYDEQTTNEIIYLECLRPMIQSAFLSKSKITCFAYGQTGSGKTFTMMGQGQNCPGLYLFASYDIFNIIETNDSFKNLQIYSSFYEIYSGKLFDLLNNRKTLIAREDAKQNINIVGLTEKKVVNLQGLMNLIESGEKARTVGVTGANSDSSRSHGVLQIRIVNPVNDSLHGKITFVDLAGSEREADKIDVDKKTRIDGAEINKSLLALKECIRALDMDKKHAPFRGSKLTLVLRDSFIGANCKTLMIANISPSSSSADHTLNTLRYADRVKELKSKDVSIGAGNVNLNYMSNNSTNSNSNNQKPKVNPQVLIANLLNNASENNGKENLNQNGQEQIYKQVVCLRPKGSILSNSVNGNNIEDSEMSSENIVDEIKKKHEKILNEIIKEEESCVITHKQHVDSMVEMLKIEMEEINNMQKPNSDIVSYIQRTKQIFTQQMQQIQFMNSKLDKFHQLLIEEDQLANQINIENNNQTNNNINSTTSNIFSLTENQDDILI